MRRRHHLLVEPVGIEHHVQLAGNWRTITPTGPHIITATDPNGWGSHLEGHHGRADTMTAREPAEHPTSPQSRPDGPLAPRGVVRP